MTKPNPDKLKVLWQKGRNYFTTFFVELKEVHKEIGDNRAFASWCVTDLHIGLDTLTNVSSLLKKADAAIVKRDLAASRQAEKSQRAAQRAAETKAREEERARKAIIKAQKKEQNKRAQKQKHDRDYRRRKKAEKLAKYAASAKANGQWLKVTETELIGVLKTTCSKLVEIENQSYAIRQQWIDVSIELASLLCQARTKFESNNKFGDWLDKNDVQIERHKREALQNLGANLEAMRIALNQTERTSYQYIWKSVQLRLGKD